MSGNVDVEALPIAVSSQFSVLRVVAVETDNNNVPITSYGVNVLDLINGVSAITGIITPSIESVSSVGVLLPNMPVISTTGGLASITGQITATRTDTFDAAQWTINLLVNRTNGGSLCNVKGDVTPSLFYADTSLLGLSVVLSANTSGPTVEVIGLDNVAVSWSSTLNTTLIT
jgi:hypothetical protein